MKRQFSEPVFKMLGEVAEMLISDQAGREYRFVFDAADLDLVREFPGRWYVVRNKKGTLAYAAAHRRRVKNDITFLHRLIACPPPRALVDHRDRDTFNNRRSNLRIADKTMNGLNVSARGESGIRGVCRSHNKFVARVKIGPTVHKLGMFDDPVTAGAAVESFLAAAMSTYQPTL